MYDGEQCEYNQGSGYKAGECVTVDVNIKQSQIIFTVDGVIICACVSDKIKDRNIKWVPYIVLFNKDD